MWLGFVNLVTENYSERSCHQGSFGENAIDQHHLNVLW